MDFVPSVAPGHRSLLFSRLDANTSARRRHGATGRATAVRESGGAILRVEPEQKSRSSLTETRTRTEEGGGRQIPRIFLSEHKCQRKARNVLQVFSQCAKTLPSVFAHGVTVARLPRPETMRKFGALPTRPHLTRCHKGNTLLDPCEK